MLGRLGTMAVVLTLVFVPTCSAAASPQDLASTHTYLTSGYTTLKGAIASFGLIGRNIDKVNGKLHSECFQAGLDSPQNEESQQMSYEVFGLLEATGYHTDAKLVGRFVRTVRHLRWSSSKVTRAARDFATSLQELVDLPTPDLCGDVRAWSATGFTKVPASTTKFDRHLEAIEGEPIPRHLLIPYVTPADKALVDRDIRLETQLEHMETLRGQDWWDMTLETLALNQ